MAKQLVSDGLWAVVDLSALVPGTKPVDLSRRKERTLDYFRRKLAGDPSAPHLFDEDQWSARCSGRSSISLPHEALQPSCPS